MSNDTILVDNYEIEESEEEIDDGLKYEVENCIEKLKPKEKENIDTLFRTIRASGINNTHWGALLKVFLMEEVPQVDYSFIKKNIEYLDLNKKRLGFINSVLNDKKKLNYYLSDLIQLNEEKNLTCTNCTDCTKYENTEFKDSNLSKIMREFVYNKNIPTEIKRDFTKYGYLINYRLNPPTMEQFLSEKWIGPTGSSIYKHVKKVLTEFWADDSPYRNLLLSSCIGFGKTLAAVISGLFVATNLSLMRDPKGFHGLSEATSLSIGLVSFSLQKIEQILIQPFITILETAPMFKKITQEGQLKREQKENPNKICWSTAGRVGELQFPNDIHIIVASTSYHLLGLTLVGVILSEINYFIQRGISPEKIWRVYNDAKGRIFSRFSNRHFATTILDSSPNDMELSPIDKYIFGGKAQKDQSNYVVIANHWDTFPEKYKEYQKTKKTFPVFRGGGSRPPKILSNDELKNYNPLEIFHVPIDAYNKFQDDLKKSIKDFCGFPSGAVGKLFDNIEDIENMFSPQLENVYSYIQAPASKDPEKLIWNQIKDDFFSDFGGYCEFYRASREKRYIHVDLAESGDAAGIGIVHPECDEKTGKMMIIVDMSIAIAPKKDKINLDAIACFLDDLYRIGRLPIAKITFDQFQSSTIIQRLKRLGYEADTFSVDRDTQPYRIFASYVRNGRIKAGRNIVLKNNLKSLQEVRKGDRIKIDHVSITSPVFHNEDWDTSLVGIGQKDLSDAVCGATACCIAEYRGTPKYQFDTEADNLSDEENERRMYEKINARLQADGFKPINFEQ